MRMSVVTGVTLALYSYPSSAPSINLPLYPRLYPICLLTGQHDLKLYTDIFKLCSDKMKQPKWSQRQLGL